MISRPVAEEKKIRIRRRRMKSQIILVFLNVLLFVYMLGTRFVWGTERMITLNCLFLSLIWLTLIFFTIFKYVIIKDVYESQKFNQWREMEEIMLQEPDPEDRFLALEEQYGICPDIDIFEGSGFTEEEKEYYLRKAIEDEQYDEDPEEHSLRLVTEEIERSFANKKPSTPLQRKAARVIADLLFL